jgi:hypothetical protein
MVSSQSRDVILFIQGPAKTFKLTETLRASSDEPHINTNDPQLAAVNGTFSCTRVLSHPSSPTSQLQEQP